MKIQPQSVNQLLHKNMSEHYEGKALAKGLPTSPWVVVGVFIFDADDDVEQAKKQRKYYY